MNRDYLCPLCQSPLSCGQFAFTCKNNHSFDLAKEGYVNLLPVQMKKSKQPGDNLEMVQARRAFLGKGHYRFLADALAETVASHDTNGKRIYDLGCGEGYYTRFVAKANPGAMVFGVDISKSAIKYAAKRYPECHFSVASIKNAPFEKGSGDVLVSVFAPLFDEELARLAAHEGKLVVASPGPDHLQQLKAKIYHTVNPHTPPATPPGFVLTTQKVIEQTVMLDLETTAELIKMTPFAWKFNPEQWQALATSPEHEVTLAFYISEYERSD